MRVKGYLVADWNVFEKGTEVTVDLLPMYEEQIKNDYLHSLLMATIEDVVCEEYLECFEDVREWHEYIDELMDQPNDLFKGFVTGELRDAIEQRAEEIWEENKPKYYPVDVVITTTVRMYVRAKNEDDVERAFDYIDAEDIVSRDVCDYEVEDYCISDPEEHVDRIYAVYDAEEEMFV